MRALFVFFYDGKYVSNAIQMDIEDVQIYDLTLSSLESVRHPARPPRQRKTPAAIATLKQEENYTGILQLNRSICSQLTSQSIAVRGDMGPFHLHGTDCKSLLKSGVRQSFIQPSAIQSWNYLFIQYATHFESVMTLSFFSLARPLLISCHKVRRFLHLNPLGHRLVTGIYNIHHFRAQGGRREPLK